ncbi:U-scoloptoxin(18)-Er1a-like [Stegodyphus dumicola]|uniref:U-scoloptoxin(18)-Er1a-like n=1 Tax=Stegodyphus dumicola TaxID=202533 RepID=UPI0015ABE30F|nr:U-scoloptoxin(18)-Er1a-like [Stegodyphus dumicola]
MNSLVTLLSCCMLLLMLASASDKDLKPKGLMSELVQKPIFYAGEVRSTERAFGDPCQFSFECESGCCLQEKNGKRKCTRKMKKNERCSVSQVKLDLYMDYCPCEKGNKYCSDDPEPRCTA